ncbi:hypothetical protein [Mesoplasma whartonense]|uniref:hypothetical protein n=1 Tax=Mesoplasma whartonense TaxID=2878854 RepID=UPI002022AE66|nr:MULTISPECIES: hypothetical protein [unclassified Mesoplasma]MCL8212872.1 hypothetical protein [Mesoplasma sp. JKS002661]MCL8216071.1 hypothetical protein [Mesoplasma sp. JKS002657]
MNKGIFFIDIEGGKGSLEEHFLKNLCSNAYKNYFLTYSNYLFVNYVLLKHPAKGNILRKSDKLKLKKIEFEDEIVFVVLCDNDGQISQKKKKEVLEVIRSGLLENRNAPKEIEIYFLLLPEQQSFEFLIALMISPLHTKGKLSLNSPKSAIGILKKIPTYAKSGKIGWTQDKELFDTIVRFNKSPRLLENIRENLDRFRNYTTRDVRAKFGDNFVAIDYIIENLDIKSNGIN